MKGASLAPVAGLMRLSLTRGRRFGPPASVRMSASRGLFERSQLPRRHRDPTQLSANLGGSRPSPVRSASTGNYLADDDIIRIDVIYNGHQSPCRSGPRGSPLPDSMGHPAHHNSDDPCI
jgi:hypothetical protein